MYSHDTSINIELEVLANVTKFKKKRGGRDIQAYRLGKER